MNTKNNEISVYKRLFKLINKKRQFQLLSVLFLMFFCSFAEVVSISSIIPFLSVITDPQSFFNLSYAQPLINFLNIDEPKDLMLPITLIFSIAIAFSGLMRFILLWSLTRLCHAIGADISLRIYELTVNQPYEVHLSRNSSEVIAGITLKSNGVVFQTLIPSLTLLSSFLMLISILFALVLIDPFISLVSFISFGFLYLIIILLSKSRLSLYGRTITNKQNKLIKVLQEGLNSIRDIILDGSQPFFTKTFSEVDLPLRRAQANVQIVSGSPKFFIESFGIILIAGLAYILSISDGGVLDYIPVLGALALGAQKMLPIIQHSFDSWSKLTGGKATLEDALELLEQKMPEIPKINTSKSLIFKDNINLEGIKFSYKNTNKNVIENVSFQINKGDRLGFIGETGSGKSTMIDIVMGLLKPQSGSIYVDGRELNESNIRNWQTKIAHVPQSIFLIDATIAENIAFGVPKEMIDLKRVISSAKIAQMHDIINKMNNKYDSYVGEKANKLSGGQRQRIAIARALYKKMEIIILDEASSALDSNTEKKLMESIDLIDKNITIIMIAHRLSTLKNCNKIIEFNNGKIKKIGTYEDITT